MSFRHLPHILRSKTVLKTATATMMTAVSLPVLVSLPSNPSYSTEPLFEGETYLSTQHHKKGGGFVNPWASFRDLGMGPMVLVNMWRDWRKVKIPALEELPPFVGDVDWGKGRTDWKGKIKATWLGHACYVVEFPSTVQGAHRGPRVLFDPIFSHRCSPSQYLGPARVTKSPIELSQLPEIDAVIISHNHYDHLDLDTLRHIYSSQTPGSVHFFAPLGNKDWFKSNIGTKEEEVTELDWWGERELIVQIGENGQKEKLRVVCTPCQHFTGRSPFDRNATLWASWAVIAQKGRVWFGGDTGYKAVPRGTKPEDEAGLPTCPAFKEIGQRFGGFDFAMIPIGAYSPRWFMSRIHANPSDAVHIHQDVQSRQSAPMHFATFVLTDEEMTEPPRLLRQECDKRGIKEADFRVSGFGETVAAEASSRCPELGGANDGQPKSKM
ncbi:BZ3500_MvSof-1268-A1-R1_Chr1-3g02486 [Microbotryum saponariae]|uniref:BZ3500_MvSof-1268-A1-R1_Chr1-3g02486 protein n=1 Tax=Microbotryum saponariae TaxID=289078 RepID=A0A2X0KR99_9BASI|nr:BZ3500_MvSof-1268-A1-R1_Chr1-3g02486 [Microbotryum saponariae]SCZ96372.1 BZ3501_MvSof-1269-A2-R1_Chr1-3g02089 [Microbotryum saponariae]